MGGLKGVNSVIKISTDSLHWHKPSNALLANTSEQSRGNTSIKIRRKQIIELCAICQIVERPVAGVCSWKLARSADFYNRLCVYRKVMRLSAASNRTF